MTFTVPFQILMALHLLPTLIVVACAWVVFRAVSLRIDWRKR